MQIHSLRLRVFSFVIGIAALIFSAAASADPPLRVARLGYTSGAVSFSPAGEVDWVQAMVNRPLTTGDRLWVDAGARAEIQDGAAMVRLSANTSISVLNLDDRITQLQLTQGILNVRLRHLANSQVFEVATPNLAFTLRQNGDYRIAVDPDGNTTDVIVRNGQGEVMGEGAGYIVDAQQRYRFRGVDLRDYEFLEAPRPDEFDRWASDRDRAFDNSISARYVSRDVIGLQDLDANGYWHVDPNYGNVWIPNRVAADWAPYRDGHWAWIDPWGWTWVDDAPWGFAVSHYGRWAYLGRGWGWVPGPVRSAAYYAPALVVFVGGDNFRLAISGGNVGAVAWFPLAPREVYRPSFSASRAYFENVNRSNTVISKTIINNSYNVTNITNVVYANRNVSGAVVAVPRNSFVQSQPVSGARVHLSRDQLANTAMASTPQVAPTEQSVRGAAVSRERPPTRVLERPVVTVTAPPAAHFGFAAQKQQLTMNPGRPLDDKSRRELHPAAAAPAPVFKVLPVAPSAPLRQPNSLSTSQAPAVQTPAQPTPVPQASAAQPTGQRGRPEQRGIRPVEPSQPGVVPRPPTMSAPLQQQQQILQPQRAPEAKVFTPAFAPPAPPAPAIQQTPKSELVPAAKQLEPRVPAAAPRVPAAPKPQPQAEPTPRAEQRGPRPAASQPQDREAGRDAPKREEESRKSKN